MCAFLLTENTMANSRKAVKSQKLQKLAGTADQFIEEAARLLDEEMAAGIVAAQRVQRRFRLERRIDQTDFKEAFEKFQSHAHDMVSVVGQRVEMFRSPEVQKSAERFVNHAHGILDLFAEMISTGAELADQIAQATKSKEASPPRKQKRPRK
jgi:hypothetical protein